MNRVIVFDALVELLVAAAHLIEPLRIALCLRFEGGDGSAVGVAKIFTVMLITANSIYQILRHRTVMWIY